MCVYECVCGLGSGSHEGIRENKKKTERKKGENEKSVFLFSFSVLVSG